MTFTQDPPRLGNQFDDDALLQEVLQRSLPAPVLTSVLPELRHLGELAGGELYALQLEDRLNEPRLVSWDPWGNRVDRVEVTAVWKRAAVLAARHGFVAAAYEPTHGPHAREHQMAMNYLIDASVDVYTCPLAMTDGAARVLLDLGNRALIDRAVPRLTSRDPERMWTSGQWMTERTGGSDVGESETEARPGPDGHRLHGTKWFTSAVTSQMALTLARPQGAPAGSRGLALFYLELRKADGSPNGILVNRLKDKLGTRKVPTAELTLDGALAVPVAGLDAGVKNIAPMLNVTRLWNSVGAIAGMRRAVALARDYARRRAAFGGLLADRPLHVDTVAGLQAELEGALLLTFRTAQLLARKESGAARDAEQKLLRLLTPLCKLTTGKQAVAVTSEAIEAFGGAGYVEDTGLPRILRDAQVLPIWEGTTNVLSLDALRALAIDGTLEALAEEVSVRLSAARDPSLAVTVGAVRAALTHATAWLAASRPEPVRLEAGARRFALTLGRSLALALLADHAQWCLDRGGSRRSLAAARRYAAHGIDLIREEIDPEEGRLLLEGP